MPLPIPRPSLVTSLSQRYAHQPVGGAYDARNIIEVGVDPLFASAKGSQFQIENGFETEIQLGVSQFKNEGLGISIYDDGLDVTPYKAVGIPVGRLS